MLTWEISQSLLQECPGETQSSGTGPFITLYPSPTHLSPCSQERGGPHLDQEKGEICLKIHHMKGKRKQSEAEHPRARLFPFSSAKTCQVQKKLPAAKQDEPGIQPNLFTQVNDHNLKKIPQQELRMLFSDTVWPWCSMLIPQGHRGCQENVKSSDPFSFLSLSLFSPFVLSSSLFPFLNFCWRQTSLLKILPKFWQTF